MAFPLAGSVQVQLIQIARGTEQLETLRFEAVNPTFLLSVSKRSMNDATWKEYRDLLPRLYQSMGILGMVRGDGATTQARLAKASELDPKDPLNYLFLPISNMT